MTLKFDWKEYAKLIRAAVAEGVVLLKNDDEALPINRGSKVSVFGRIQLDYYSAGAGSGGMVNTPYEVSILDGLMACEEISLNESLIDMYKKFEESHPFDPGVGWAQEPYFQEEMKLTEDIVNDAAEKSDVAVIVIGRCAGEDKDAVAQKGSYYLTDDEENMLSLVCARFEKTVVLLNVGSVMDMRWVEKYNPKAVMYVWQGGVEGGNGIADVLTGKVSPSGHLTDTIARNYEDYPSSDNFGKEDHNYYVEDVYVGYRYFESAAKDKVLYPFGFGLSYTSFETKITDFACDSTDVKGKVTVKVLVTNTGKAAGKEVIQIYYEPAQGKLKKPVRNLIRFEKTELLLPGSSQELTFEYEVGEMASYDDSNATGCRACYVLEAGCYKVYAGENVREAKLAGAFDISELQVVSRHTPALMPVADFERMVISDGVVSKESVPKRDYDLEQRIIDNRPADRPCSGRSDYKLIDVANGKVSMDEFLDQLTDLDLIHLSRGEGMCSPKATPGIAGAYGGVSERLKNVLGIPVAGCSDGPAGIRMDCGTMAFSLPSGTLLACSFNKALVSELFEYEAKELRMNKIDTLLGPGMNIHRNPLNGRNFEYFSEDPYVTGAMACAELKSLHKYGVTGTLKHFAANNQEFCRHTANSVVSERAVREIYLKGYEMAVKNENAYSIMSTYGPVNGTWTAGSYDLHTTILRNEWGFKGIVMTDWWPRVGGDQEYGERNNTAPMVRAQNDVFMVVSDAVANSNNDNEEEWLAAGKITRGELYRNAKNICSALIKSVPAMNTVSYGDTIEWEEYNRPKTKRGRVITMPKSDIDINGVTYLPLDGIETSAGTTVQYPLIIKEPGQYGLHFKMKSDLGEVAQMNVSVAVNKTIKGAFTMNGTNGEWVEKVAPMEVFISVENYVDVMFGQSGLEIDSIWVTKK